MNILVFDDQTDSHAVSRNQILADELKRRNHHSILFTNFKTANGIRTPWETAQIIGMIILEDSITGFVFDLMVNNNKSYGVEVLEALAEYLPPEHTRVVVWSDYATDDTLVPRLEILGVTRRFKRLKTRYDIIAAEFD